MRNTESGTTSVPRGGVLVIGPDPGRMARLESVKRDPLAMVVIAQRVAEGESLKSIARAWEVPHGPLLMWIMEDDARMTVYRNGLIAAGFTEADEAKEIADAATPEDATVAKLRADVRRWGASKKAPEFFGERLDVQVLKTLPSEETLLAQLHSIVSAQPWLMDQLLAMRGNAALPVQTYTQAAETAAPDPTTAPEGAISGEAP